MISRLKLTTSPLAAAIARHTPIDEPSTIRRMVLEAIVDEAIVEQWPERPGLVARIDVAQASEAPPAGGVEAADRPLRGTLSSLCGELDRLADETTQYSEPCALHKASFHHEDGSAEKRSNG